MENFRLDVGPDAEIVTNTLGGKQSKVIGRLDLVDPELLRLFLPPIADPLIRRMEGHITNKDMMIQFFNLYNTKFNKDALIEVSRVLEYGARRYSRNNWRLIPFEDHLNHALIHLYAYKLGDTQDDHLEHALTRVMMAVATGEEPYDFKGIEKK